MDCNWTEKISQLVDGELPAGEAGAVERHAAGCPACRLAREDFMLLRRQLVSYRVERNPRAERLALGKILGGASGARGASVGWRERAASVFALPRLSPALGAAAALVLVAVVIGLVTMRGGKNVEVARDSNSAPQKNSNVNVVSAPQKNANVNVTTATAAPPEVANVARDDAGKNVEIAAKDGTAGDATRGAAASVVRAKGAPNMKPRRTPPLDVNGAAGETAMGTPKDVRRLKLPLTPNISVDPTELIESQLASLSTKVETTDSAAARHVEQAQVLLRSFRNARAGGDDPATTEIAREKRRSKELLYRNILLRREAASRGNVEVESLLSNLEPILIDIANLPDKPAQDEVRSITERMRKKNIVAMLQVADASHIY